jgi:hypothetical protein
LRKTGAVINERLFALVVLMLLGGCGDREVTAFSCEERGSLAENAMGSPVPVAETTFVLDKRKRALFQVAWTDDADAAPGFIPLCSWCADFRITDESITGTATRTRLAIDRIRGTGMFHWEGVGNATYSRCHRAPVPKAYWTDPDVGSDRQFKR